MGYLDVVRHIVCCAVPVRHMVCCEAHGMLRSTCPRHTCVSMCHVHTCVPLPLYTNYHFTPHTTLSTSGPQHKKAFIYHDGQKSSAHLRVRQDTGMRCNTLDHTATRMASCYTLQHRCRAARNTANKTHTVQEGTDISASTFKTGLHMPSRNHTVSTAHTYTPHRTHRVSKICLGGMAPVLMLARERRA